MEPRFGRVITAMITPFTADGALDRIRGGDLDWFTKPMIDSYHTVWFELHENLLATLGIQRAKEKEHAAG